MLAFADDAAPARFEEADIGLQSRLAAFAEPPEHGYRRVMLVSLKCCFSVLLRWFAKLLRALALILCHALLAAPLHQRWD
jgi:hypothetical protein